MIKLLLGTDPMAHVCIVDNCDLKTISGFNWVLSGDKNYAVAEKQGKFIYMHRLILNAPAHLLVDHINMNGLDNRRINLRLCTKGQNAVNKPKRHCKITKYKGVVFRNEKHRKNKWAVIVRKDYKTKLCGHYPTEAVAAYVYNLIAPHFHGEFFKGNDIPACELKTIDLEKYRGKATTYVDVRLKRGSNEA